MQCTISAAGGFNLTISAILAVMLIAMAAGGGWHFGRWLVWLATHRIDQH